MSPPPPPYSSVVAAFEARRLRTPERVLIRVVGGGGEVTELTYQSLHDGALRAARGFRARGVQRGDRIVVALTTSPSFFHVYLGALMAGVVPTVVPGPRKKTPLELYAGHVGLLVGATEARLLLVDENAPPGLEEQLNLPVLQWSELESQQGDSGVELEPPPGQLAHLQATSGSTGIPRLAEVRHGNITANVAAIGRAIRHREDDVLLSWLPLFHDMGLIGISYTLLWDCPLVTTEPRSFAWNPLSWPRMMQRFKGTLSPAPNSAFKICARQGERGELDSLDLSCWRVALCGAEPIHADTIAHFQRVFGPKGFRAGTMLPVYGLAEATLAATMSEVETPPRVDEIDVEALQSAGRCIPASASGRSMKIVCVGKALPGHEVRVVDSEGNPLPPRQVGEVELSGPSVIAGYWGAEGPDPSLKRASGHLRTGDLGYLAGEQLYITGRQKDIVIVHGRNFVPSQLEDEVARVIGSSLVNGIAAVGVQDRQTNSEGLRLIIESTELPRPNQAAEERLIRDRLEHAFGLTGIRIHWKPKGWNPKTTSGKLQRYRCKEKLLAEEEGSA